MSTVIEQNKSIIESITFPVALAEIKALKDRVTALTIAGIDDEEGREAVKKARLECRDLRNSIDKRRKDLKADSIAYGKKVESVANILQDELAPAEQHCKDEEKKIQDELDRIAYEQECQLYLIRSRRWDEAGGPLATREYILTFSQEEFDDEVAKVTETSRKKREADEAAAKENERVIADRIALEKSQRDATLRQLKIASRLKQFASVGIFPDFDVIAEMSDDDFEASFNEKKVAFDAEQELKEKERLRLKAIQDAADLAEQQKRDQESEAKRLSDLEQARLDGIAEAEAKQKREADAAEVVRLAEVARVAKEEAARPNKEKLANLCVTIMELTLPYISLEVDQKLKAARLSFVKAIEKISGDL